MLFLKLNQYGRILSCLKRLRAYTTHTSSLFTHFLSLLNSISNLPSLLRIHSRIITSGHSNDVFLTAKLISVYSDFDGAEVAAKLFGEMPQRDTFLWNSIIKTHFSRGFFEGAVQYYHEMRLSGARLDNFTFPMVLAACAELYDLKEGETVHGIIFRLGLLCCNPVVCSSLMYLYVKCGRMMEAYQLFEEMSLGDVVPWTVLIVGYVRNGDYVRSLDCFRSMFSEGVKPNLRTIEAGLLACSNSGAIYDGKCLHGYLVKNGIDVSASIQSALLSMYCKCENIGDAESVFDQLFEKDLVSWTAIIGVYSRNGYKAEGFELFQKMCVSGICPDGILISCLLMSCQSMYRSMTLHGLIIKLGLEVQTFLCNSLVSMYLKFNCLEIAYQVFDKTAQRDTKSWNLMISGYSAKCFVLESMELFRKMQLEMNPDSNSLVILLSACSQIAALREGRCIHGYAIKRSMHEITSLGNTLVDMYANCGDLNAAIFSFHIMDKDIVSWNIMISAYSGSGHSIRAISLFCQMQIENMKPNSATFASVLPACSENTSLRVGECIHGLIKKMGFESDEPLYTTLIDMYAKCGKLDDARELFDLMPFKDVVSWNAMISGYGMHGHAENSFQLFDAMKEAGVNPNSVTFLTILSACSHTGMLSAGKQYFSLMDEFSIMPSVKHYACLVDLLGRSGHLSEALELIRSMKCSPDGAVWGSLLGACRLHNNIALAEIATEEILKLDSRNDGYYVLMSNLYGSAGRSGDEEHVREIMKRRNVRKRPGWSSVEISGDTTVFFVGDTSHTNSESIYATIEALLKHTEDLDFLRGA